MKIFNVITLFFLGYGLQAQVSSVAVSQTDLNFQAGTIYIEMNIESGRMAQSEIVEPTLRISPNPVNDLLYFITEESINKATVYDMSGRKMIECTIVENKVDLSQLVHGSYIIVIQGATPKGFVFLKN